MWNKKGLVYCPDGKNGWDQGYAHVVCNDDIYETGLRVIYSARNGNRPCIPSFVDVEPTDFTKVNYVHPEPILELGKIGTFDDCGIMPTWLLHHPNGEKWLYYIGWTIRNTIPYHNAIGLAISKDGVHYEKKFTGPVISTIPTEPQFSGSCCVLHDEGIFKMWYLNCTEWIVVDGLAEPAYHIKYAESPDGIYWDRKGIVAIDYIDGKPSGISRPSVVKEVDGTYSMWYSFRGMYDFRGADAAESYRIGYATSVDGINWTRKDAEVGIKVSESGWDSEMIEYPMVFDFGEKRHLFYNGNHHGKTGFGWATLTENNS
ncbi:MAG: hypothetical protein QMB24_01715 [Spirosomataceae bacterium]